jgi:hypothetical protein
VAETRADKLFLLACCLLTTLKVFLGVASLPFFSEVDESAHFDLVQKYARGYWPNKRVERLEASTARIDAMFGTIEFTNSPQQFRGGKIPPPTWRLPDDGRRKALLDRLNAYLESQTNHEVHSPPIYYGLAALWLLVGEAVGFQDGALVYWVRALNVVLYVGLIVLAFEYCRRQFSGAVAWMVCLLLAFLPDPNHWLVNSDNLSPLVFLGATLTLVHWREKERPSIAVGLAAGLLTAATWLVKLSNVAIWVVFFTYIGLKAADLRRARALRENLQIMLVPVLAATLPVLLWVGRNYLVLGDPLGTEEKTAELGWSRKHGREIFQHPIFGGSGLTTFGTTFLTTTWRGHLRWHNSQVEIATYDRFYLIVSITFIAAAAFSLTFFRARYSGQERLSYVLAFVALGTSVAFLVAVSLLFDFGDCVYPSRAFPFVALGRLVSGTLVFFLVIFAHGIELMWLRSRWLAAGVLLLCTAVMSAQYYTYVVEVLPSAYNWFHLPGK